MSRRVWAVDRFGWALGTPISREDSTIFRFFLELNLICMRCMNENNYMLAIGEHFLLLRNQRPHSIISLL